MSALINTNMSSLVAQSNLNASQSSLQTSLQRLSSGLRINSAKDDAAGLSIASRMTSQISGLSQASRNANDGISMAQTAEGALGQISDNLQRMRDLSVQAANGTNSTSDRAAIQAEISQLSSEIDRVASSTAFNGNNLLDGSLQNASFQVGANAGQSISMSITSAKAGSLGLGGGSLQSLGVTTGLGGGALTAANQPATQAAGASITTTNASTGAVQQGFIGPANNDGVSYVGGVQSGKTSALAAANAVNAISSVDGGVSATALTVVSSGNITATAGLLAGSILVNGVDIGAVASSTTATGQTSSIAAAINAKSAQTGVTASVNANGISYTLTAADGRNIDIAQPVGGTGTAISVANDGFVAATTYGQVSLHSNASFVLADGTGPSAVNQIGIAAATSAASANSSGSLDVSTQAGASNAITSLDAALATVSSQRAMLGAIQNRFASVVTNLQSTALNLTASRSRIQDADFAAETGNLTRAQILQQAGTAMLAQANSVPNGVMALLR